MCPASGTMRCTAFGIWLAVARPELSDTSVAPLMTKVGTDIPAKRSFRLTETRARKISEIDLPESPGVDLSKASRR